MGGYIFNHLELLGAVLARTTPPNYMLVSMDECVPPSAELSVVLLEIWNMRENDSSSTISLELTKLLLELEQHASLVLILHHLIKVPDVAKIGIDGDYF